ncbi:hypothetical protein, partial [Undibacterium sp.]|uniref:hypothetical protein n=1 Tax=Undibacterium sp. TaxID=1914977 RepID=UPI00374D7CB1
MKKLYGYKNLACLGMNYSFSLISAAMHTQIQQAGNGVGRSWIALGVFIAKTRPRRKLFAGGFHSGLR